VAVGVTDVRGIGAGLAAALAGTPARFESGARLAVLGDGVHAALPAGVSLEAGAPLDFSITLPLQGTGELRVTPVGRESAVRIRSSWPHPAFIGDFLPLTRAVSDAGFDARWQTSFFATNLEQLARDCARRADCRLAGRATPQLGVALIDPVDHYARTQRATRYAVLIIALTFAGFLLCEVLAGIPVHPVQYGLVGLALALFHLLLLSLSEHFGFAAAYALATLASVALLGVYLTAVLRSRLLGAGFAAGLGLLLGLLRR
jgi:inner membrane protein